MTRKVFFYHFDVSFVGEESNMAVMEISLPSGYVMDEDSLPALRTIKDVKRIETTGGGTGVSLYFDKVSTPRRTEFYRVFFFLDFYRT